MPLLVYSVLEVLSSTFMKENKDIQGKGEVKLSLCKDGLIMYLEKSQEIHKKAIRLIHELRKFSREKVNIQKNNISILWWCLTFHKFLDNFPFKR